MVLSDPQWWFNEIVVPNYQDFVDNPLCQRRAFNALVTTFHMWERLYWYYREIGSPHLGSRSKGTFLAYLKSKSQCPDLEVLEDAANSVKHSLRPVPPVPFLPQFMATGQAAQVSRDGEEVLVIEPTGREVRDLLDTVMQFWTKWLRDHPDP